MTAAQTDKQSSKIQAAGLSVGSNSLLVLAKLGVGLWVGSVAIVSEAIHSANDLIAAMLALYAVRCAGVPADEDHRYGHGKFESVSAAIEAALISVAACAIVITAIRKLTVGVEVGRPWIGAVVMAVSALINLAVSSHLFNVARRTDSIALMADAWHLRADVYTAGGTGVAMLVIAVSGWHIIDPIIAIVVALMILRTGWRLIGDSLGQMLDRSLPEDEAAISRLIEQHGRQVVGFHRLRSRRAGPHRYFDVHIVVCRDLNVAEAHELTDHLEQRVQEILPDSEITIHVEPCNRAREECEGRTRCLHVSA